MAKYTGANITATFGSTAWGCITSVEVTQTADVYAQSCAGASYKSKVVGPTDASFTISYLADAVAEQTALVPGTTGTFSCSLNATAAAQYTGAGIIESHNVSAPVEGFVTGTVTVGIDGALTIS